MDANSSFSYSEDMQSVCYARARYISKRRAEERKPFLPGTSFDTEAVKNSAGICEIKSVEFTTHTTGNNFHIGECSTRGPALQSKSG